MQEAAKLQDSLYVPTREEWDGMSSSEREIRETEIISALAREFNLLGETTRHFNCRVLAVDTLKRYYGKKGRTVFIGSDLHTLYPGERAFYPDLLVVFDVENRDRRCWNVLEEKKGLDFVLEVLSRDTKRKDKIEKLSLYARIEIPEYFLFDPELMEMKGYRLDKGVYREITPKDNFFYSDILRLQLKVENWKIRFYHPDGFEIPFTDELLDRLNEKITGKDVLLKDYALQLEEEKRKAEEEKRKALEEKQRADAAEAEVRRLKELLKEG